jgi:hypothetical protein
MAGIDPAAVDRRLMAGNGSPPAFLYERLLFDT